MTYGFHPRFNISIPGNSINPLVKECACALEDIHRDLSPKLTLARDQYKTQADCHRSVPPIFAVGDQVWLLH